MKEEGKIIITSLRAVNNKGELEYAFSKKSLTDTIAYCQYLINSHRIHDKGAETQQRIKALYDQGILFDHTKAAIADDDENWESKKKLTKEEIMAEPVKVKKERVLEDMWICPKPKKKGERDE